jgi:hypothetical protein
MLRMQWNALRVGDRVLVHDAEDPYLALVPGLVTSVQPASGSNDLSIRLLSVRGSRGRVVCPQRLAVHMDPRGTDEACWRCGLPDR